MIKKYITVVGGVLVAGASVLSASAENVPQARSGMMQGGPRGTSTVSGRGEHVGGMMGSSSMPMMRENSDKQIIGKISSVTGSQVVISSPSRNDRSTTVSYTVDFGSAKIIKDGTQVNVTSLSPNEYVHVVLVGKTTESPLVGATVIVMSTSSRMMSGTSTGRMMDADGNKGMMMHASTTPVVQTDVGQVKQGFFKRIGNFFSSFFH